MSRAAAVAFALVAVACRRDPSPPAPSTGQGSAAPVAPRPPDALPPAPAFAADPIAAPAELAATVQLVPFASGFERPVALVPVPGDARQRLFVVEQTGRIRVIEGGRRTEAVVLDLSRQVSDGNEQGLLGLALHPRFAET